MPEPIVFISHFAIKEGKLDALMETARPRAEALEAGKPRTLVFLAYLDAKRTTVSFLHAFASAEDMDKHFEGAQERAAAAYEFIEPRGWELYGSPSDHAFGSLERAASSAGVPFNVQPEFLAGFLRMS